MNDTNLDNKHFTRGGQIILHNLRMFFQIMDKVVIIAGIMFILITSLMVWYKTTSYDRYLLKEYGIANTITWLNPVAITSFIQPNNIPVKVRYIDVANSSWMKEQIRFICRKLLIAVIAGISCSMVLMFALSHFLRKQGEKHTKDNPLKGDTILPAKETKKIIVAKNQHSDLSLAGLPLIKYTETAHLFFHGTTGTGKSNAIKELLDQIRKRGDRAIIYDKSCNILETFYQSRTDVVLNPLDIRGREWDLWGECRDSADFDSLAAAQIPMPLSTQDPFWINAARTIFSVAAFEMRNDKDRSVLKLLRMLLTADLELIQHYLKGTEAATLVSDKIEKTAVSIKSVLATYLKSLKYVTEGENPFSIRQWIQDDNAKNWLFITSLGDRHETIKPLITAWLDIAVNSLLSLSPCDNRRIWFILDELPSLQQLPYLTQVLAEGRKFGGCIVVGVQTYSDLAKLYGPDGAKSISALLNTRVMFRIPDPDIAEWSAKNFGESVVDEVREGISYGANSMRDGISINRSETKKPLVSYSEIMSLSNLFAFVRLPGEFPISKVDFVYKQRKKFNQGFLLRDFDENRLKEVDILIDTAEKGVDVINDTKTQTIKRRKQKKKTVVEMQTDDAELLRE